MKLRSSISFKQLLIIYLLIVGQTFAYLPISLADDEIEDSPAATTPRLGGALNAFRKARNDAQNEGKSEGEGSEADQATQVVDTEDLIGDLTGSLGAEVNLSDLSNAEAAEAVDALKAMGNDPSFFESEMLVDSRLVSASLLFQNAEQFKRLLDEVLKEVRVPGDHDNIEFYFNSSIYPSVSSRIVNEVDEVVQAIQDREAELDEKKPNWRNRGSRFMEPEIGGFGNSYNTTGINSYNMGYVAPELPNYSYQSLGLSGKKGWDMELNGLYSKLDAIKERNGGKFPTKPILKINISAGLIAFLEHRDELAAILAQALSRQNPKVYGLLNDTRLRNLLAKVAGYSGLHEEEQHLVKADLGAIERLRAAGYNIWSLHRFERRVFDKLIDRGIRKKTRYMLNRRLLSKTLKSVEIDKIRPVRHLGMEAWIGELTQTEKNLVKDNKPLPTEFKKLQRVVSKFVMPYYSLKAAILTPVVGGTVFLSAQPIIAVLSALGIEAAVTTAALSTIGTIATGGAIVLGGVGGAAVTGTLLYLGYVNRKDIARASKVRLLHAADKTQDFILGTKVAANKSVRSIVEGGSKVIYLTAGGVKYGFSKLGVVADYTLIRPSKFILHHSTDKIGKRIAYVGNLAKEEMEVKRERSRALALFKNFAVDGAGNVEKLQAVIDNIHDTMFELDEKRQKSAEFKDELRRISLIGGTLAQIHSRPDLAVRAANTYSFYYNLIQRMNRLIERSNLTLAQIEELFATSSFSKTPMDIKDSGRYQGILLSMINIIESKADPADFEAFLQKHRGRLGNTLDLAVLVYDIQNTLANKDLIQATKLFEILKKKNMETTHKALYRELWLDVIKTLIDPTNQLHEVEKVQLTEFLHNYLDYGADRLKLPKGFYSSLSDEELISLISQSTNLKIDRNKRYRSAKKALISRLLKKLGNKAAVREKITKIATQTRGNLSPFIEDLYADNEFVDFETAAELKDYHNYLASKRFKNFAEISKQEVLHFIQQLTQLIDNGKIDLKNLADAIQSTLPGVLKEKDLFSEDMLAALSRLDQSFSNLEPYLNSKDHSYIRSSSLDNFAALGRLASIFTKFNSATPEDSLSDGNLLDVLEKMDSNFERYHSTLSTWLSNNLKPLLVGLSRVDDQNGVGSRYLEFLYKMTFRGLGSGNRTFMKREQSHEQGITFKKVLPSKTLQSVMESLDLQVQTSLLGYVIELESKNQKDHKGRHYNAFFGARSLTSNKLEKLVQRYAKKFVEENRDGSQFSERIKQAFPLYSRLNVVTGAIVAEAKNQGLSVESNAQIKEILDTLGLTISRGARDNFLLKYFPQDTLEFMVTLFTPRIKSGSKTVLEFTEKQLMTQPYMQTALLFPFLQGFPSEVLVEMSMAIEKSGNYSIPNLAELPALTLHDAMVTDTIKNTRTVEKWITNDEAKKRELKEVEEEYNVPWVQYNIDFLAHLARTYKALEGDFNPQNLVTVIKHLLPMASILNYDGLDGDKYYAGYYNLAEIFRTYGSQLFKYAISKEASTEERHVIFNLIRSISFERKTIDGVDHDHLDEYKSKFNRINNHFDRPAFLKYPEIEKIATKNLDATEIEIWKTLAATNYIRAYTGRFSSKPKNTAIPHEYSEFAKWIKAANSMRELDQFIESEVASRGAVLQKLAGKLFEGISKRKDLIDGVEDALTLLRNDAYWPESNYNDYTASPLERPFVRIISRKQEAAKRGEANPGSWNYAPSFSENAHSFIYNRLKELNQVPTDFDGLFNLWVSLTDRGVTSISDRILSDLIDRANDEQKEKIKSVAVKEQRIFETTVRDQLVVEQIEEMSEYQMLVEDTSLSEDERFEQLVTIVENLQSLMPERGLRYEQFLEDLSVKIMSSQKESQYIHSQTGLGANSNVQTSDENINALYDIVESIVNWPAKEQYNFILFLRGDAPASSYIKEQFPLVGAERIKRMYEIMPVEYRLGVLNFYLGQTFFFDAENLDVSKGYPRKLIEQAITGGKKSTDPEQIKAQEVTRQILLAGLSGIKNGSKDAEFQKLIVANILAFPQDTEGSVGKTLKLVLEKGFGPLGVKMGQLIVAMNILSPKDAKALLDVQDNARPLQREEQYAEFKDIIGSDLLPFTMKDLLGSASIKWAIKGRVVEDGSELQDIAIKVFRSEVEAMLHNRYVVLEEMIEYLVKNVGPEFKIMSAIVESAKRAVEKELDGEAEVRRSRQAKENIYINLDDEESRVIVPEEDFESGRIIISQYLEGTSFHRLPDPIKHIAAQKILQMEKDILFADADEITFDPDRHGGNYRIHLPKYDGERYIVFEPIQYGVIDFGQLLTIKREVRDNLINIFALSQIISSSGTMPLLTERLGSMFGLEGDKLTELGKVLRTYFPNKKLKKQTAYFATLSALHEVGIDLDPGYFDFARAVLQLMQYEPYVADGFTPPSKELENRIISKITEHLRDLADDSRAKIMARNLWNRAESIFTKKDYRPITTQITEEEVRNFAFDGTVYQEEADANRSAPKAVFGFTCEAQFR